MKLRHLTRSSRTALAIALAAPAVIALPQAAHAQPAAQSFSIPAGDLRAALQAFSSSTGIQLVYSSDLVVGKRSSGVSGEMTAQAALARLLAGTGLSARMSGNSATITRAGAAGEIAAQDGERVLGPVRIEGDQGSPYFGGAGRAAGVNGVNGSRDITATEGTGSFTSGALTIGSKVAQSMKDVPQSISVLTSERLEQQNVTDFTTAMRQLPGITLVQGGSSMETQFLSRGFLINSIQIDGGAPLSMSFGLRDGYNPQIDMSIYDHVEILRGAAGQFGAYGNPSGTVNLVRKKPLDHGQLTIDAQAGSWSNYRLVVDATTPLAFDGKLRGRLVTTYQDQRYFYDRAKLNKILIYGVTELDVTPTTLLTAGLNYTKQDTVPWIGGLPRYQTGADLKLPRSTSLVFPWNRWDFETRELFGTLEQKIGSEWLLKLNVTQNRQTSFRKTAGSEGAVNPVNGLGPDMIGAYYDTGSEQLSAEATLTGAFMLFGQRQEVTMGVNRVASDATDGFAYQALILGASFNLYQPYANGPIYCGSGPAFCPAGTVNRTYPPVNVLNFNPNDPIYTEPRAPLASGRFLENGQVRSSAYLNLRLTAFDRLHLTTGLRWTREETNQIQQALCVNLASSGCVGKAIGDVRSEPLNRHYGSTDFSWPPAANLSFDVTKALTVYAGYTDIYASQSQYRTVQETALAPVTGGNWEAGVKWAARDGKLNLTLAAYRMQQKGSAIRDMSIPEYEVSQGVRCCYIGDPNNIVQSTGIDVEVSGELRRGLQFSASYNYNKTTYEGKTYEEYGMAGTTYNSISPRHVYKLWMSYDFGAAGHSGKISGLTLSGGVNGQSSAYYTGYFCQNYIGEPNPVNGQQECASWGPPDFAPYEFTVPAYAVVSARIDYRFSDKWSLALNLENILDKTYYQTVSNSPSSGHWYGAPRSVTASLRAKW
ncbi:TonB-dependent siderophore receptor [Sphingomonas colocasiae]|uniref:TonB-dependent receptor n=1 Tax=Sphingomonas colocasiae TaxID=1848973 RepID=A0ABS7PPS5_9SPHN|nr:TonB-dependent receptor [Sphingomonas colocasiae]MBY8823332.1 TonB-dependent receptor [Sphingomonas colocasiae]